MPQPRRQADVLLRRPEAQKNAIELWRRIAQRYADRSQWAISYDFFNEPAYMNRDHWNEIVKEMTAVIRRGRLRNGDE
ncbi:MAG: cellulase family glycosylhydrolase [Planctomycetota bacterium]